MKRPKIIILVIVCLLLVAGIFARLSAHKAASDYGHVFKQAFSSVGVATFADTSKLHEFLASPQMSAPLNRLHALSFVGGSYTASADELQRGMIYLSEQMAAPSPLRFSNPPTFSYLSFPIADHSDRGEADAAMSLFASYESQL